MALSKDKIKLYHDKDPRYNFTIEDSDEFNTPVLPFYIRQKYRVNTRSLDPMLRGGCEGQRYEHCVSDPFDDKYITCDTQFTTPFEDVRSFPPYCNRDMIKTTPKKLNKNSFYTGTYIYKPENPTVVIDYSPDTPKKTNNVDRSVVKKANEHFSGSMSADNGNNDQRLEHCVSLGIYPGGTCGVCGPICCPCLPSWIAPEDSCILCLCLCIILICLPCLLICCGCIRNIIG